MEVFAQENPNMWPMSESGERCEEALCSVLAAFKKSYLKIKNTFTEAGLDSGL